MASPPARGKIDSVELQRPTRPFALRGRPMKPDRRDFLRSAAATGVATAAMSMNAKSYGQVPGANERIGIAFLGVGGRCQQHIDTILQLQTENRNNVTP